MGTERKTVMVSARIPRTLIERADFVARNIDNDIVRNRSAALQAALETWLPEQEERLRELGLLPKKAR